MQFVMTERPFPYLKTVTGHSDILNLKRLQVRLAAVCFMKSNCRKLSVARVEPQGDL